MPDTRRDWPPRTATTPTPSSGHPPKDTATADALIATLQGSGVEADPGEFTLSPEMARSKMRAYQLAEPLQFVLLLVQAAVLRGARRLSFEFDTDDVRLVFDGEGLDRQELEGIHGALFARRPGPAHASLQELALGLNAAEALGPAVVRVRSTSASGTWELALHPGAPQSLGAASPGEWPTEVLVRFGIGRNPRDEIRELLLERCRYASPDIFLDRSRISRGMKLPGALPVVPFSGPALRGVAGWSADAELRSGELRLVKNGVWFATLRPGLLSGAVVVVEGDLLRKTLSQDAVVQDEALAPVIDAARAAHRASLHALVDHWAAEREHGDARARHAVLRLFRAICGPVLSSGASLQPDAGDPIASALLEAPMWPLFEGIAQGSRPRLVSVEALRTHLRRGGAVGAVDLAQLRDEWFRWDVWDDIWPGAPPGNRLEAWEVRQELDPTRSFEAVDWVEVGLGVLELLVASREVPPPLADGRRPPSLPPPTIRSSAWALVASPPGRPLGPVLILLDLSLAEVQTLRGLLAPPTGH